MKIGTNRRPVTKCREVQCKVAAPPIPRVPWQPSPDTQAPVNHLYRELSSHAGHLGNHLNFACLTSSALFSVHPAVSSVCCALSLSHCALSLVHYAPHSPHHHPPPLLIRGALPSVLYCCITHQPAALDADLDHLN